MSTGSLEASEAAAAAVAKTPNRITLESIERKIVAQYFTTGDKIAQFQNMPVSDPLKVLTICVLVLDNGFTFVGKSAPADIANFNADLGKKLAREDAFRQIWPMEGYLLRSKLANNG